MQDPEETPHPGCAGQQVGACRAALMLSPEFHSSYRHTPTFALPFSRLFHFSNPIDALQWISMDPARR